MRVQGDFGGRGVCGGPSLVGRMHPAHMCGAWRKWEGLMGSSLADWRRGIGPYSMLGASHYVSWIPWIEGRETWGWERGKQEGLFRMTKDGNGNSHCHASGGGGGGRLGY